MMGSPPVPGFWRGRRLKRTLFYLIVQGAGQPKEISIARLRTIHLRFSEIRGIRTRCSIAVLFGIERTSTIAQFLISTWFSASNAITRSLLSIGVWRYLPKVSLIAQSPILTNRSAWIQRILPHTDFAPLLTTGGGTSIDRSMISIWQISSPPRTRRFTTTALRYLLIRASLIAPLRTTIRRSDSIRTAGGPKAV